MNHHQKIKNASLAMVLFALLLAIQSVNPTDIVYAASVPGMRLPYDAGYTSIDYTSGPHGGATQFDCSVMRSVPLMSGVDFGMPVGTEVLAVAGGTVALAGNVGGAIGKRVVIDHGGGFATEYWHLDSIDASIMQGTGVEQGRVLGTSGFSGTGAHLHLEFSNWPSGSSFQAHGLTIDGYTIRAYIRASDGLGFNYQGTLTRGVETESVGPYGICNNQQVRSWTGAEGTWTAGDDRGVPSTNRRNTGGGNVKAAMSSPIPGTTLAATTVTFNWTAGTNVQQYYLWVGTTPGGYGIYAQPDSDTSAVVTGLPTSGPVHVRLWSRFGASDWQYNDYTYTGGGGGGTRAAMATPTPGTTLTGAAVIFTWTAGTNVQQYALWVGTTPGGYNVHANYHSGTGVALSNLPVNGQPVYVRLWSRFGASDWQFNDYSYTAAAATGAKATMTSPPPGSTLAGSSVTFTWTAGTNAEQYALWVGTTPGGYNMHANYHSGTSATVGGLPTNGGPVYVRLWTRIAGAWQSNDYTYTAATIGGAAQMTSPAPGSTLNSASVTFTWTTVSGAEQYALWVGTAPGGYNVHANYHSGTSATVSGLPTGGGLVYVRLWTKVGGVWVSRDYTYTAATVIGETYHIVLDWGARPIDLDSHLWLPAATPFHVYYGQRGSATAFPFSSLDIDDRDGFGPETITISRRQPGVYTYEVRNFSGEVALASSGARVRVYRGASLVNTFAVPPFGTGTVWTVFRIDNSGAVVPVGTIGSTVTGVATTGMGESAEEADKP